MTDSPNSTSNDLEGLHAEADDRSAHSAVAERRSPTRSPWWKWPIRLILALMVLILLLLTGLRYGGIPLAMWQLDRWYSQQSPDSGLVYRASLRDWQLSLMDGELSLSDFYLHHPDETDSDAKTGFERLSVSLDTAKLLGFGWDLVAASVAASVTGAQPEKSIDQPAEPSAGQGADSAPDQALILLRDVQWHGLVVSGRSSLGGIEGAIQVAGLDIPIPAASQSDQPDSADEDGASPLPFRLEQLDFSNWQLRWSHADAAQGIKAELDLALDQFGLAQLDTRVGHPLSVILKTRLEQFVAEVPKPADAPLTRDLTAELITPLSLDVNATIADWQPEAADKPRATGSIAVDQLQLTLLNDLTLVLAHLGLEGFSVQPTGSADAGRQNVAVELDQLDLKQLSLRSKSSPDLTFDLYRYLLSGVTFEPTSSNSPQHQPPRLTLGKQSLSGLALTANLNQHNLPVGLDWLKTPEITHNPATAAKNTQAQVTNLPDNPADPKAPEEQQRGLPIQLKAAPISLRDLSLRLEHPAAQLALSSPDMAIGAIDSGQVRTIDQSGKLVVENLVLPEAGVKLLQPLKLDWQLQLNDWLRLPRAEGRFQMQELALSTRGQPDVYLDQLQLSGLDASAKRQSLDLLALSGLVVRHPDESSAPSSESREAPAVGQSSLPNTPLLVLRQLRVPDVSHEDKLVATGLIEFSGAEMSVLKRANGQLAGFPEPAQSPAQSSEQPSPTSEPVAEPPVTVTLRGIRQGIQAGDQRSQLHWTDRSVSPAYQADVTLHSFEVGAINTGKFDFAAKGLSTPMIPVDVVVGLDQFNRIIFDGAMGMQKGTPAGNFTFRIDQLDLVPLSPYVVQAMGYRVQKGMLELNLDMGINNGDMNGEARLNLQNSQFDPADEDIIANVSQQIAMPVETALSVLKDDNNNIRLTIPVTGPIDDPNVGIDDVLAKVSTAAVQTATLFYLKQAFQPYGALISLGSLVSEELFAIRLDPLDYAPYVHQLSAEQKTYLQRVANMMTPKPELELQVCPYYTGAELSPEQPDSPKTVDKDSKSGQQADTPSPKADAEAWGQALTGVQLANQRAVSVKAYLATFTDDKGKSLARRITLCSPAEYPQAKVEMGF